MGIISVSIIARKKIIVHFSASVFQIGLLVSTVFCCQGKHDMASSKIEVHFFFQIKVFV